MAVMAVPNKVLFSLTPILVAMAVLCHLNVLIVLVPLDHQLLLQAVVVLQALQVLLLLTHMLLHVLLDLIQNYGQI